MIGFQIEHPQATYGCLMLHLIKKLLGS